MTSTRHAAHNPSGDPLRLADIHAMRAAIAGVTDSDQDQVCPGGGEETAVMQLRALEELKNAITARQAELTVQWAREQRARDVARNAAVASGEEAARCGAAGTAVLSTHHDLRRRRRLTPADTARVVTSQVALALRVSPHRASRWITLSEALVTQLPRTFTALRAGVISQQHATIVARHTGYLSSQHRAQVDAAISAELGAASLWRLEAATKEHAYRLDPAAATARRAHAETERYVSLRPAPDTMTWLSALLPVKDGVGVYAALTAATQRTPSTEDDRRGKGQQMADTLVQLITGRPASNAPSHPPVSTGQTTDAASGTGDATPPTPTTPTAPVPVAVNLLMPLGSLTGDTPAMLENYGPIPADLARDLLAGAGEKVRRIFHYPHSGDLISMDSTARTYPGLLATFTRLRDHRCRGAYCGAPITQIDHIRPHATGGPTSERNAQGECTHCNLAKEHPDYLVTGHAGHTHIKTGGLHATSRPPAPPGGPPPTDSIRERLIITRLSGITLDYGPAA